ncbi:hypothetical protein ACE7GA_00695 [Roseomonas sp. CCTCC AB2023176]|uniref:hypothetical protein n=1 Tax=Roseomonas sp. CCTCC AB2023176 TaxID=3342640 RepID=UPI0035D8D4FB
MNAPILPPGATTPPRPATEAMTTHAPGPLPGSLPSTFPGAALRARLRAALSPAWAARLWRAAAFLPALAFLATVLSPPFNHDVAAVLNFSERWLAGERLYADLIDVNPPLIFVLNLIPAAIAAWTPLEGPGALLACLVAFAALCWWLSARLRAGMEEGPIHAAFLTAGIPLAFLLPGYDFGQREVLMGTVAVPYALLAARRIAGLPTSRPLLLGTALLAAIGFALKPYFLAVPLLVEAAVLLCRVAFPPSLPRLVRALRDPVPWTMAAVWLLYLAAIPLLFPDYFGHVVPLVWKYYVDLGDLSLFSVLLEPRMAEVALLLVMVSTLCLLRRWGPQVLTLWAAAAGAFVSGWVQHKGWTYHAAPVLMLGLLTAALIAARWLDRVLAPAQARRLSWRLAALLCAGVFLVTVRGGEAPMREIHWSSERGGRLTAWLRQNAYGERLLVLTPDIFPIYPALNYANAQSTLRFMNLWLLQGTNNRCPESGERYNEPWEMSRAEFYVYRTVAEDFARAPPSAVLVTRHVGIPWCGREFDFIEYFSRHPLFAEAFSNYRAAGEIEGYRLFVRDE